MVMRESLALSKWRRNAAEVVRATFRSMTEVNSSITAPDLSRLARSARNLSPVDKTWYGLNHVGTEFRPEPASFSWASCVLEKWAAMDLSGSQEIGSGVPKCLSRIDFPDPDGPTMSPIP